MTDFAVKDLVSVPGVACAQVREVTPTRLLVEFDRTSLTRRTFGWRIIRRWVKKADATKIGHSDEWITQVAGVAYVKALVKKDIACRWCDQVIEPNAVGAQLCPARDGDLCEINE